MPDEPKKADIDFDELDKAVASLMGKVGNETIEGEGEKTKTFVINSTLKPDEAPQYGELEKTAKKIGDETLMTASNMVVTEDPSKLPDRMDLPYTVEESPTESAVSADQEASTPQEPPAQTEPEAAPTPVSVPLQPPMPAPVTAPIAPRPNSGRFMDMVHPRGDMKVPVASTPSRVGAMLQPLSTAESLAAPQPVIKTSQPPAVTTPLSDATPIATPFLPDAKVEKRPLGGGAPVASDEAESVVETVAINSEDNATRDDAVDAQRPLDPEYFEKESSTEQALAQIEKTEAGIEQAPTIEKVESGDTGKLKASQPADGNAIYDVKNYHQPLAHPKKQKSGWGVVVIIVIIVVLAAALGAAAYFILGLGV